MEKFEMSLAELEGQHAELVPDRIEMRRFNRRRNRNRNHGGGGFLQDCDQASVNTGILPINVGGQNAICLSQ
jgi:hypothetical protein